jgi:hypothetical protein
MVRHHFRIGSARCASAFDVPPGPYEITRLLPLADGVPQYRAKSFGDGHECAVSEPSLRPVRKPANSNDPRPFGRNSGCARSSSFREQTLDHSDDVGAIHGSSEKLTEPFGVLAVPLACGEQDPDAWLFSCAP